MTDLLSRTTPTAAIPPTRKLLISEGERGERLARVRERLENKRFTGASVFSQRMVIDRE